jgi:hypothetical protein
MMYLFFMMSMLGCENKLEAETKECSADLECLAPDGLSPCVDCEPVCQEDHLPTEDRRHLPDPIDYEVKPPAAGAHNPCWYDWGVFETEVPDERWVHNMEHGGVIFLYNCPEGCEGELNALVAAFGDKERVIISPYPDMRWRFAATAWERRILMNCLDIDKLSGFYDSYFAKGPEDVASMPASGCMEDEDSGGDNDSGTGADSGASSDSGAATDSGAAAEPSASL